MLSDQPQMEVNLVLILVQCNSSKKKFNTSMCWRVQSNYVFCRESLSIQGSGSQRKICRPCILSLNIHSNSSRKGGCHFESATYHPVCQWTISKKRKKRKKRKPLFLHSCTRMLCFKINYNCVVGNRGWNWQTRQGETFSMCFVSRKLPWIRYKNIKILLFGIQIFLLL